MHVKLQLVMCGDDGQEETITDIITLQKDSQHIEHLGLTLREAKQLLNTLQQHLLQRQVEGFLEASSTCLDCGTPLKAKGSHTRTFRTLFGTFKLTSPRLFLCPCQRRKTTTFRPMTSLLPESVAPELLLMHNFEVIVGKSTLAFTRDEDEETPSSKRFGFVQTVDTKSKRRLYEVLQSQGFQLNQQITFLSDGGDSVRDLQLDMSPEAEHILDWFHLTMRLTVLDQYAKGLVHGDQTLGEEIRDKIERLKWSLWHGNLSKAFYKIDDIESLIYNFEETYPKFKQLLKAVEEFRTYITNNRHLIPNYGERYRHGEAIATGFVEATVNQVVSKRFCKKQQMQWSKRGAHLLLQTRVKTLNRELESVFKRWYPDMQVGEVPDAA